MHIPEKIAAIQMMIIMFLNAYIDVPMLAPMIAIQMVKVTLKYGRCDMSCIVYVMCVMLLCR